LISIQATDGPGFQCHLIRTCLTSSLN